MGAGMQETYQVTAALKYLPHCKHVAVLTDARFSGVSTGACIGHVGPEALAGGPIGKVLDGDLIEIVIDRNRLEGAINLVGQGETLFGAEEGTRVLAERPPRPDLAPDPDLPEDTRGPHQHGWVTYLGRLAIRATGGDPGADPNAD